MTDLKRIYEYLLCDNIKEFENEIFKIIPELVAEKDFNQKSEWHCYDVWDHTITVISSCDRNPEDRLILLLHDIGKPFSYQDDNNVRHFKNHAIKSSEIASRILERLNVDEETSETMLRLIEMHSSKINREDINKDNIAFYKRLLKIKMCDASGYEKEHSKKILEELEKEMEMLEELESTYETNNKVK